MAQNAKQQPKQNPKSERDAQAQLSLIEALQALMAKMAKASTEADARQGLEQLEQIRSSFRDGKGRKDSDTALAREAELMLARVEKLLRQLHRRLSKQRRVQEGEAMQTIAHQMESSLPSLLPTELIDAVVHATVEKEPDPPKTSAPASTAPEYPLKPRRQRKQHHRPADKKPPVVQEKKAQNLPEATQEAAKPLEAKLDPQPPKAAPKPEEHSAANPNIDPVVRPDPPQKPTEKGGWNHCERLVAHMAASLEEDPRFFEQLRDAAKRPEQRLPAPADDQDAETHYRLVHDLGKRLVNLELRAKALIEKDSAAPKLPLLRAGAREMKLFLRDLKTAKQTLPQMAGEYERLFGGYAEQFRQMQPDKGAALLEACSREASPERRPAQPAQEEARPQDDSLRQEAEAPQLVLRRRESWEQ